ncbi:MAG: alpha-2-macroglobulin, partial [Oscillochloris sp.]|nr:alpha-2-macroglobulin [Oscillochloris sp.]
DYQITIGAAAADPYGDTLGKDVSISFQTAPLPPSLMIAGGSNVMTYSSYTSTRVPIQTVNVSSVSYNLYRLSRAQFGDLIAATQDYERWQSYAPGSSFKSETVTPQGPRNRVNLTLLDIGKLDPGAYLIDVRRDGQNERQMVLVSPTSLTIKRSQKQLFVWAVDLASGKPVANLALEATSLFYGESGQKLGEVEDLGKTDADGVITSGFATTNAYNTIYVWSAEGVPFTFSTTDWGAGIDPWSFSLAGSIEQSPLVGSLSTDRPIYRPVETVHVKGVIRLDDDGRYRMLDAGQRATLTVSDPEGNQIYSSTLELNSFGTFTTDIPLSGDAPLGTYHMSAQREREPSYYGFYGSFNVAEYRKPVFEITVSPAREDVLMGEAIEATATARYFAGGVLANAPLHWRLLAKPYYFSPDTAPGYQFENLDDAYAWYRWFDNPTAAQGHLVAEGSATTDAQGQFTLKLPPGTANDPHSQALTLDIEVTDIDGQVIASQGSLKLHAGAFYIGMRPDGYVAQVGQEQQVDL